MSSLSTVGFPLAILTVSPMWKITSESDFFFALEFLIIFSAALVFPSCTMVSINGIFSSKLFTSSVFKVAILVAGGKVLKNEAGLSK